MEFLGAGAQNVHVRLQNIDDGAWASNLVVSTKATGSSGGSLTERLRVTSTGNVGVGTAAPAAKFHVAGSARFDGPVHIEPQGDVLMGEFGEEP